MVDGDCVMWGTILKLPSLISVQERTVSKNTLSTNLFYTLEGSYKARYSTGSFIPTVTILLLEFILQLLITGVSKMMLELCT